MTTSRKAQVDDLLPLGPRMRRVFPALLKGSRHGYAIVEEVEACSRDRVKVGPGTLYGALQSLGKKGSLEVVPNEPGDDPRTHYHELTPLGFKVVEAETERQEDLLRAIKAHNVQQGRAESG